MIEQPASISALIRRTIADWAHVAAASRRRGIAGVTWLARHRKAPQGQAA
jgi:hypothetical protein